MIIDYRRDIPDEERERLEELFERYWNWQHRCDENAPYWGDGPNALQPWEKEHEDDYEDADVNDYYDNLLSYDEREECEEWEHRSASFHSRMLKDDYVRVDVGSITNKEAKFLIEKDYSSIVYWSPLEFKYYVYIKGEKGQIHYRVAHEGFNEAHAEILHRRHGWLKFDKAIHYNEEGFKNSQEVVKWLEANCEKTYTYNVIRNAATWAEYRIYFESYRDAIHFRMIL